MSSGKLTLGSRIVTEPNDVNVVPGIIQQLHEGLVNLQLNEDEVRLDFLSKARKLVQALETPKETMLKHCWAQVRHLSYTVHLVLPLQILHT